MKTNNSSPLPSGQEAARVNWNTVPMVNTYKYDAILTAQTWMHRRKPAPSPSRRRRVTVFLIPIVVAVVALLLTACESTPGDIAKYSPSGGRSGGQSAQMVAVLTPEVLRPTAIPPTAPALPTRVIEPTPAPIEALFQPMVATVVPAANSLAQQSATAVYTSGDEAGAWALVAMIGGACFVGGLIVGLMLGGRHG